MLENLHTGFLQFLTTLGLIAFVVIVIYFLEERRKKKVKADTDYAIMKHKFESKQNIRPNDDTEK